MKKEKLILVRKQKGYTQKDIAYVISTDISNYNRKENAILSRTSKEYVSLLEKK